MSTIESFLRFKKKFGHTNIPNQGTNCNHHSDYRQKRSVEYNTPQYQENKIKRSNFLYFKQLQVRSLQVRPSTKAFKKKETN